MPTDEELGKRVTELENILRVTHGQFRVFLAKWEETAWCSALEHLDEVKGLLTLYSPEETGHLSREQGLIRERGREMNYYQRWIDAINEEQKLSERNTVLEARVLRLVEIAGRFKLDCLDYKDECHKIKDSKKNPEDEEAMSFIREAARLLRVRAAEGETEKPREYV